ncbi:MAG TPA: DUF3084 domain-containing protein [Cyanobacteria bacterium UBA12227]|nr:DUF3084 domain-containing protein [Cyanobacteria bacterium UBA12227]HAX85406.1 DUF3084 domain-containing protein [Cyanobacteria bacterium UBA11370]HBY80222.1 DUF3084 domain-containing protein [Cyanobacteria bacterium UBA11148]
MTSAYILIAAILILGGVIATLGDRIGTKVGKARLSLFKLRPRNTATLVTIITGSLISATTLGILFGLSESLREGVFELDNILKTLRRTRREVDTLNNQKTQVESELTKVQKRLNATNRNFQQAQSQLKDISQQAIDLQKEIKSLLVERQALLQERNQLNAEITNLETEVNQLKTLVEQRDQELAERDRTIQERNQQLAEQETQLKDISQQATDLRTEIKSLLVEREEIIQQRNQLLAERQQLLTQRNQLKEQITQLDTQVTQLRDLVAQRDRELEEREKQRAFLERQVDILEQYYQNYQVLRQGNVALLRGQVLAFGVVRIVNPSAASVAVDQLLSEANRTATEIIQPNNNFNEPLVQITETQANQLINQIKDGRDYVVRLLSAGNYVQGEMQIQVFADTALNQVLFKPSDILAAISIDASTKTDEQIQQRLDQLLAASQFRARRAGVLGIIQVGDGTSPTEIVRFIEQLEQHNQPLEIQARVQEVAYTAGPLKIQLVAIQNGQVIFST